MRLVTLDDGDLGRPGAILADGDIVDLQIAGKVLGARTVPGSVRAILAGGADLIGPLGAMVQAVQADRSGRLQAMGAVRAPDSALLAPIPDPRLIVSTGGNYRSHMSEMKAEQPKKPGGFIKSSGAVTGSGRPILLPADHAAMVDWEGEFAFVFGSPCHNVTAAEAMDHVAGYTILNDVSARDWAGGLFDAAEPRAAVDAWFANILGKQFPTFAPLGPAILTRDEAPDPSALTLQTRVNGQVMQSAVVGDLAFSFGEIIAHFAQWYGFLPGDILTTGTPAGVGYARDPKQFLKAGDVVEVEVDGIGVLRNPVAAAADRGA